MSTEELVERGRDFAELRRWSNKIYDELLTAEHAIIMALAEQGRKSIRVDDVTLKVVPGKSPRYSPSQRKRVRGVAFTALTGPLDQPVRLVVEGPRRG
jgi:hypothetical protein